MVEMARLKGDPNWKQLAQDLLDEPVRVPEKCGMVVDDPSPNRYKRGPSGRESD